MTASSVQITSSGGTHLATNSYSEGGITKHDERFTVGEFSLATYRITGQGSSVATTNDDVFQVMAGGTLKVYVRRIRVWQAGLSAASNTVALDLFRVTTAGTGGTAVTPRKFNAADAAAGCTAATAVPQATRGTAGDLMGRYRMTLVSAQPTNPNGAYVIWQATPDIESIRITEGTSNGLVLRVVAGVTTTPTLDWEVDVVEMDH